MPSNNSSSASIKTAAQQEKPLQDNNNNNNEEEAPVKISNSCDDNEIEVSTIPISNDDDENENGNGTEDDTAEDINSNDKKNDNTEEDLTDGSSTTVTTTTTTTATTATTVDDEKKDEEENKINNNDKEEETTDTSSSSSSSSPAVVVEETVTTTRSNDDTTKKEEEDVDNNIKSKEQTEKEEKVGNDDGDDNDEDFDTIHNSPNKNKISSTVGDDDEEEEGGNSNNKKCIPVPTTTTETSSQSQNNNNNNKILSRLKAIKKSNNNTIHENDVPIIKEILLRLECVSCHGITPSPIYQCKNGHIICDACRRYVLGQKSNKAAATIENITRQSSSVVETLTSNINNIVLNTFPSGTSNNNSNNSNNNNNNNNLSCVCPECKVSIATINDVGRNLVLEQLASKLTVPCRFESCNKAIKYDNLSMHIELCKSKSSNEIGSNDIDSNYGASILKSTEWIDAVEYFNIKTKKIIKNETNEQEKEQDGSSSSSGSDSSSGSGGGGIYKNIITSKLNCQFCNEIAPSPIMSCLNGHITCKDCYDRMTKNISIDKNPKCPCCNVKIASSSSSSSKAITTITDLTTGGSKKKEKRSSKMYHNLHLEELALKRCLVSCRYKGCTERVMHDDLALHLLICEHQPVTCQHCVLEKEDNNNNKTTTATTMLKNETNNFCLYEDWDKMWDHYQTVHMKKSNPVDYTNITLGKVHVNKMLDGALNFVSWGHCIDVINNNQPVRFFPGIYYSKERQTFFISIRYMGPLPSNVNVNNNNTITENDDDDEEKSKKYYRLVVSSLNDNSNSNNNSNVQQESSSSDVMKKKEDQEEKDESSNSSNSMNNNSTTTNKKHTVEGVISALSYRIPFEKTIDHPCLTISYFTMKYMMDNVDDDNGVLHLSITPNNSNNNNST